MSLELSFLRPPLRLSSWAFLVCSVSIWPTWLGCSSSDGAMMAGGSAGRGGSGGTSGGTDAVGRAGTAGHAGAAGHAGSGGDPSCGTSGPNCFGNDLSGCCANDPYPSTCINGHWLCGLGENPTYVSPPGCDGTLCSTLPQGGSGGQGQAGAPENEAGAGGTAEGRAAN